MATTRSKHIILVEVDWDAGNEGYGFERYRTPALDYKDLLHRVSDIHRSVSLFGEINFPKVTIELYNRDLYFSIKLANWQCVSTERIT